MFRGLTALAVAFNAVSDTPTFPDVSLYNVRSAGSALNRIAVAGAVFVTTFIAMVRLALSTLLWHVPLQSIPFISMMCALSVADTSCRIVGVGVYCAVSSMIAVLGAVNAVMINCELL